VATTEILPRWDTDSIFPGLGSRQYASGREAVMADLARLVAQYDRLDIRGGPPADPGPDDIASLEEVLAATNSLLEEVETLGAYLSALVSTDSTDDAAARADTTLQADLSVLSHLTTRLDAWIGRWNTERLVEASPAAAAHGHALRRAAVDAAHQMSEAEEDLLADLRLSGGNAWARCYNDVTSRLAGTLDGHDTPIAVLRGMATDQDPGHREAAQRAELDAWEAVAVPLAACINGIKGEALTVYGRRRWADPLEPVLHANAVERPALEALQSAAVASFPDFRRFLRAKARLLGREGGLPWWDLMAPVPGEPAVSWSDACAAVEAAFASYSPQLVGLARRAFSERWVDAEAHAGKRGGAFCMTVRGGESRVMLNFDGSFDSVQTLAHELGHAYHNAALATRTPLQRQLPMALAETASIFAETVMTAAGLAEPTTDAARLAVLNVDLEGATQVVVDIHSRFLFEQELFRRRRAGPLAVAELCEIMTEAQTATYGDGIDASTAHPYMWAAKPHYYFVDAHFYNWPYCFGLLFGMGLYARYQQDQGRFRSGYDDLLASTGMGTAAELAGRFGIDLTAVDFWTASLDVLRGRIDEFCALAGGC